LMIAMKASATTKSINVINLIQLLRVRFNRPFEQLQINTSLQVISPLC
jgi:hypothetical protein